MNFIGIISEDNSFYNIKNILKRNLEEDIKLIHITKKSIGNIKNIKFETIVIDMNLNKFSQEINTIKKICNNARYIVINTDINPDVGIYNLKTNVLSYGLNRRATITISSITENSVLVYLQRNFKNIKGNVIEIGESIVRVKEDEKIKIYEILIIYTIFLIKQKSITEQTMEKSNFFKQN